MEWILYLNVVRLSFNEKASSSNFSACTQGGLVASHWICSPSGFKAIGRHISLSDFGSRFTLFHDGKLSERGLRNPWDSSGVTLAALWAPYNLTDLERERERVKQKTTMSLVPSSLFRLKQKQQRPLSVAPSLRCPLSAFKGQGQATTSFMSYFITFPLGNEKFPFLRSFLHQFLKFDWFNKLAWID